MYKRKISTNFLVRIFENILGGSFLSIALIISRQIPVEKGNSKLNKKAFAKARKYLNRGHYIGIYPVGKFEKGNENDKNYGVAKLAIDNNVGVLPCGLKYPKIGNRELLVPECKKIILRFGKQIYPRKIRNTGKKKTYSKLRDIISKEINKLKA
jgi:1-acyl-sn-glycerol-3-phosphate acyltransferase